ncbi:MAG: AMP-binding protein, partial [Actinomycetota bacterium]
MQEYLDHSGDATASRTLIDILRASAEQHPQASALEDADGALSYAELLALVWQTAARLRENGVDKGDRVGVRMPSGDRELYIAILGIMAAGAAYVPVDADDPQERADLVFGEAGVAGVITGAGVYEPRASAASETTRALFDGDAPHPSSSAISTAPMPTVDDDAWIIFTSGSTGVPKGVAVTHRSAAAFVDAEARLFLQDAPLGPGDRVGVVDFPT